MTCPRQLKKSLRNEKAHKKKRSKKKNKRDNVHTSIGTEGSKEDIKSNFLNTASVIFNLGLRQSNGLPYQIGAPGASEDEREGAGKKKGRLGSKRGIMEVGSHFEKGHRLTQGMGNG